MRKNEGYVIGILDALLVIFILIFLIVAIPFVIAYFDDKPESIEEITNACSNMSVIDASDCALDLTKPFYRYNVENMGKDLTFEELKEQGGVCGNWSDYYSEIGKGLGYNTENVIIKIEDGFYHKFSVWSSEDGYCILDQTERSCFEVQ